MEYKDYLKTEEWRNTRNYTLFYQGCSCRVCGSTKNLNIHHRRYSYKGESILFKERQDNLLVICNSCHYLWHKLHGYGRIPFPTLRNLLNKGVPKLLAFEHPYSKAKNLLKQSISVSKTARGSNLGGGTQQPEGLTDLYVGEVKRTQPLTSTK